MTRSRYITVFEQRPIPIDDGTLGITAPEAEALMDVGEMRRGFVERRHHGVHLAQFCGVVSLGTRVLEILPKLGEAENRDQSRGVLLRLLREARELSLFRHVSTGQHLRHAPLLEVFIAAFFDSVAEIVRGGLLRYYQEREEDVRVVRGRIIAARQFAVNSNRPDRVACRFDDLTADNVWNQTLKAALRLVKPWITSVDLHRRWSELVVIFDEVSDRNARTLATERLIFHRQAARYRTAVEWARWIFSLLSPSLRAGERRAPGLLFDMNVLFQSAIASILQKRVGPDRELSLQSQETGVRLATVVSDASRRVFNLRPDLVLRRNGGIVAIGDTKWKRLDVNESGLLMPTQGDMYQMHAYATAFHCEQLALIYPWRSGLRSARRTAFSLPASGSLRPVVSVLCVDLDHPKFALARGQAEDEFARLFGGPALPSCDSVTNERTRRQPLCTA